MELLKNILIDFCLFSLIEGAIYCYFFEMICKCKKFKFYQIILLSFGNCIISQLFKPLLYQIIMILFMGIYLYILNKNINCFKYPLYMVIFMLIIEMGYNVILENLIGLDGFIVNDLILFFIILPIKIIEILIIYYYGGKRI